MKRTAAVKHHPWIVPSVLSACIFLAWRFGDAAIAIFSLPFGERFAPALAFLSGYLPIAGAAGRRLRLSRLKLREVRALELTHPDDGSSLPANYAEADPPTRSIDHLQHRFLQDGWKVREIRDLHGAAHRQATRRAQWAIWQVALLQRELWLGVAVTIISPTFAFTFGLDKGLNPNTVGNFMFSGTVTAFGLFLIATGFIKGRSDLAYYKRAAASPAPLPYMPSR